MRRVFLGATAAGLALLAAPPARGQDSADAIEVRIEGEAAFHVREGEGESSREVCRTPCAAVVHPGTRLFLYPDEHRTDVGMTGSLELPVDLRRGQKQVALIRHPRDWWFTGLGIGVGALGVGAGVAAILMPAHPSSDPSASNTGVRVSVGVLGGAMILAGVVIVASSPRFYRVDFVGTPPPQASALRFGPEGVGFAF